MTASEYAARYGVDVAEALRTLLESKHLYQSVACPTPPVVPPETLTARQGGREVRFNFDYLGAIVKRRWIASSPTSVERFSREVADVFVRFTPPDVRLFCTTDGIEPFNLVSAEDFLSTDEKSVEADGAGQLFVLSYRCQGCKRIPEAFLVRRERSRLTLSGRSPIEHVSVPAPIPKTVKQFYRGAIVAHQSGETLAGNFMLRTLIEQWARQATKSRGYADVVLDAYVEHLPEDFRNRFPVLRETYRDLSTDIHAATGSEAAFDKARGEIVRHFDARRLFEL